MLTAPTQTDFGSFPLNPQVSTSISTRADGAPLRYTHALCVLIAWTQHIFKPNPIINRYLLCLNLHSTTLTHTASH